MENEQSNLVAWVVSDNKKGHENQLSGLIEALSLRLNITSFWLRYTGFKFFKTLPKVKPDLIICAGHGTHFRALALKLLYGGKLIVLMKPSLPSSFFDGCIIPAHDSPTEKKNIFKTLGPLNPYRPEQKDVELPSTILLGGVSKHFYWNEKTLFSDIEVLAKRLKSPVWIIGSRRTPMSTIVSLRERYSDAGLRVNVFSSEQLPADWLKQNLPKLPYIWVTQDSMNMLYEALTVGACVGMIELKPKKNGRVLKGTVSLLERGWVRVLDANCELTPCDKITIPAFNESDRVAKWIIDTQLID